MGAACARASLAHRSPPADAEAGARVCGFSSYLKVLLIIGGKKFLAKFKLTKIVAAKILRMNCVLGSIQYLTIKIAVYVFAQILSRTNLMIFR